MPLENENNDQFVGIRMPRSVANKAKKAAKEDLRSLSNYIRKLIEEDLDDREKTKSPEPKSPSGGDLDPAEVENYPVNPPLALRIAEPNPTRDEGKQEG